MKKSKKIFIGITVVVGLLLILPLLVPTQTYLHKAEALASEKLGVPVVIGSAHLFLLPSPRVALNDITVGKQQELKVEELVAIPTISTLFSSNKTLDLTITKPVINKTALEFISALSAKKSEDSGSAGIHVRHIRIDELQLVWPDANYPAMHAEATLNEGYQLASASLGTIDGKLKANVVPSSNSNEQLIIVKASKWTLPVGLPLLIDAATLEMRLKGSQLEIPKIDIMLYSGKVTGNAVLSWGKNWRTSGKLNIANLAVKQPTSLVSKSVYLSGNLFSNGNFSSNAKDIAALAGNLRADFKFKINNGVLHGLDLVRVASLLIKQNQVGGATQFNAFSGLLNVSGKQYHLKNLNISSGLLTATGQVKIKPNKQLDGVVATEIENSAGLAAIPLIVSGSVSKPVVLPSKAALLGAAAGTAILGPGVGTSLGIKAAGALDSVKDLFTGDK